MAHSRAEFALETAPLLRADHCFAPLARAFADNCLETLAFGNKAAYPPFVGGSCKGQNRESREGQNPPAQIPRLENPEAEAVRLCAPDTAGAAGEYFEYVVAGTEIGKIQLAVVR